MVRFATDDHARGMGLGIDNAGPEEFARIVRTTDVFARVSPEDKLRIVEALQQAGEIVAVTGFDEKRIGRELDSFERIRYVHYSKG